MTRFIPHDVIHWGEEQLHPLRAFAIRAIEPAGITGLALRVWRATILATTSPWQFIVGLLVGVLFFLGMLTWHLGNFPVRRWAPRVLVFVLVESIAELGISSVLIVMHMERLGSRAAVWHDWWPMAGHTLVERSVVAAGYALILGVAVQVARRRMHLSSHVS
jgi:hypothetical protein